ncbi:MAG: cupin domain-containing protein [Xanthomonadales bacterium]|nr:cupin domain-containing protein [Xanthomonadales bacterium]
MKKPVINRDDLEFKGHSHGDKFEARVASVAPLIGGSKLGYRVVVLPPGKRAWPYHAHLVNEELIYVLEGSGTLRHAGEEFPVRAGDFIASPADRDQPHQLINTSDDDLSYICISTMEQPDVFFYPDSDKYGVMAGRAPGDGGENPDFLIFAREESGVPYWDGED